MFAYFRSLRGRLLLLVLLSAVPGIWLVYDTALAQRQAQVAASRAELNGLSRVAAHELGRIVIGGKHAALALAGHEAIRRMREPECSQTISNILAHAERYLNILVIDRRGKAVCSGVPLMGRRPDFSDRDYFRGAMASNEPVVGQPVLGRVTQRPGIPVAYRIRDDAGQAAGVVTTFLDLPWFMESFARSELLPDMTFTLLEADGTILLRHPVPETWVDRQLQEMPLVLARLLAGEDASIEAEGVDGVRRIYGFAPVELFRGRNLYVSVGVPRQAFVAETDALFHSTLSSLALIAGLALAVAWFLGSRLIWRQVKTLSETTERLADGDLDARVGAPYWKSELGQFAQTLDKTAESVKRSVHALRQSEGQVRKLNAELEQRVIERTAQLEAALREVEDLYDNAPCGYHSLDGNGLIVRVNRTELDWLGYAREELVGTRALPDLLTDASREVFRQNFPRFMETGVLRDVEFELVRKDGSTLPVSISATAVRDAAGAYVASRSTLFDISERKKAEAALRDRDLELSRANRQLEEASRMKSEFLANMSHELRTPLNAIIGFSEALRDGLIGELAPEQKEFVGDIFSSGEHLLELINDILDLSKVEAGMMTLEAGPVDVAGLLDMGLSIVKEKATSHHIRLKSEVESGLRLVADVRKCKQILYNLLSNAVKFTPAGGEVRVGARGADRGSMLAPIAAGMDEFRIPLPAGAAERFVEITVADSGIGIAADELGRLFQPFVQLDSSLGRKHHGTGLGLAMVRRLAELHGGTVGVASRKGKGTVFAVWLPLSSQDTGAETSPAAAGRAVLAPPPATGKATRVLVIEDNAKAAMLLRTQLESEGYTVIPARSAEDALEFLSRDKPDVISLDILLPGMDGWAFLARIKENPDLAHIPVVIVSIVAEMGQGYALGAAQVLQKPVSREALAEAMGRIGFQPGANHATVLVVDDDLKAVTLLASHLEAYGYVAQRASGGREAIEMTRHLLPDLILLDLMMPEVNGFDVVETLKGNPMTAQIPIIIVTAKEITAADRAVLNGHVEFIMSKTSFSQESFVNEVRRALRRRRQKNDNAAK